MKLESTKKLTKNVDFYLKKITIFLPLCKFWFLILDSFMISYKMMFQTKINIKYCHFYLFDFLNQKSKTLTSQQFWIKSQNKENEFKFVRMVKNMMKHENFMLVDLRKSQQNSTKLKSQIWNPKSQLFQKWSKMKSKDRYMERVLKMIKNENFIIKSQGIRVKSQFLT